MTGVVSIGPLLLLAVRCTAVLKTRGGSDVTLQMDVSRDVGGGPRDCSGARASGSASFDLAVSLCDGPAVGVLLASRLSSQDVADVVAEVLGLCDVEVFAMEVSRVVRVESVEENIGGVATVRPEVGGLVTVRYRWAVWGYQRQGLPSVWASLADRELAGDDADAKGKGQ